jgi:chitooligosaccharide deacetylase
LSGPVERGPRGRREIALTWDDGPGAATAAVLDQLGAHGVPATFFMVGGQAERDPALAQAVMAAGHAIGSHTLAHLDHEQLPGAEAVQDMLGGAMALERVLGAAPRLYRAPYGHFVPATLGAAAERGWACVGWSVLGRDWVEGETGDSIAARVSAALEPGAIVVLHDGRREKAADHGPMLAALPLILAAVRERELRPVSVPALLAA